MTIAELENRFAECWARWAGTDRGQSVIVAVSGGVDSVTLLHLFCALNRGHGWSLPLHVAHLDHRLRGAESDADAAFVAELCRRLQLPCTIESADIAARRSGHSLEEAARTARFDFFERVCDVVDCRLVALGHHADDQVETIVHRMVRGTSWRGLAGIPAVRPIRPHRPDVRIVRPLLSFRRSEILAYAEACGLPFRDDATNREATFARNRIRHDLLPVLRERFNPQVDEAILRLGAQAADLDTWLASEADRLLDVCARTQYPDETVLHSGSLARSPLFLRAAVVRAVLVRMGVGLKAIGYDHLRDSALLAEAGEEGAIDLPGRIRIERRGDQLRIRRLQNDPVSEDDLETPVTPTGATRLEPFGAVLEAEVRGVEPEEVERWLQACRGERDGYEEWLDAAAVSGRLSARLRRAGDTFQPLGMRGMKKLSDFFIDEKIDPGRRHRTIVLCDEQGPIWVAPYRIAHRVRLTSQTRRVLRLRITSS